MVLMQSYYDGDGEYHCIRLPASTGDGTTVYVCHSAGSTKIDRVVENAEVKDVIAMQRGIVILTKCR